MPRNRKIVLPYDGDPYKPGSTKQKRRRGMRVEEVVERKGMRVEEVIERKRNRAAYMHKAARQARLQQSKDGEVLDSDVVDALPNIDVDDPQAEDAMPLQLIIFAHSWQLALTAPLVHSQRFKSSTSTSRFIMSVKGIGANSRRVLISTSR